MTVRLDGIDLVVFDKDGTIIEFGAMWSGWAVALADGLATATGRPIADPLYAMLGYDPATRTVAAAAAGWPRRRWPACASGRATSCVGRGRDGAADAERALDGRLARARPGRAGPAR